MGNLLIEAINELKEEIKTTNIKLEELKAITGAK